jgi:hypothetical protein
MIRRSLLNRLWFWLILSPPELVQNKQEVKRHYIQGEDMGAFLYLPRLPCVHGHL